MTNQSSITDRIRALQIEAGEHGDTDMVAMCQRAIDGDELSLQNCVAKLWRDEESVPV